MALIVQKYGGSSVANAEKLKIVAKRVIDTVNEGNQVVVVLSAPAGMTDELTRKAKEISSNPCKREMDVLLATGEQISISLFSMALKDMGQDAISFTAYQVGIITDTKHTKAKIQSINSDKIKEQLNLGKVVVIAGFQGITENNDITTLGRGGSDTTGVALGAALSADEIEICTDVDGIYTADPRIVKNARKIDNISYEEMLELAGSGSKVLHLRSIEIAAKYGLKIHLRTTFQKEKGTIVKEEDETMEKSVVRGIGHSKNEAKITITGVPDEPGIAAKIFSEISKENVNVDIIIQNLGEQGKNDISFTVPSSDFDRARKVSLEIKNNLNAKEVISNESIGKVAIVGVGMKSNPGVAATMFKTLADANINILMISTSEIKVACIINANDVDKAVEVLHKAFNLGKEIE